MSTRYTAAADIPAPVGQIFELLVEPANHHLFDDTKMVGAPETPIRLAGVGQVFVMNMTYRSGSHLEQYQSDNHVTAFDEPRHIEWATATHKGTVLGWRWRYELEPRGDRTRVRLIYDWSTTSKENVDRFGVPLVDEAGLHSSLALLATVAAGHN